MSGQLENILPGTPAATREEIVQRAVALRGQLREDAAQVDRDRRASERNIAAITDAGLLRLFVPQRLGGLETDARTLLDVTAEIARGCPATAWVTGILNASAFLLSLFPEQAQEEVWGESPMARLCSPIAPTAEFRKVDGGISVTGKWAYASGSLHAEWAIVAVPMDRTEQGPDLHLALMPMSEMAIEDTWYVSGMRGSGSNTIVAEGVFVPEHRILPFMPALQGHARTEHVEETLYQSSLAGILVLAILGPQLGIVDQALEYVIEKAPSRMITSTIYARQSEAVPFQMDVAEAATRIDTAHLHAYRAADDVDAAAQRGELPDARTRGRIRMDCAWASRQCHAAMELLMSAHGTSGFADVSPLQRLWRDQSIASRHAAFGINPPKEMYGRVLLGKDPMISFLF
jgi:3-hydroxy-9,10-secoandrosta-1,3,5(10)-triene-9,17-dione monooxygenase